MHAHTRVFQLAKDPGHPEELQDAWRSNPAGGLAAVADGVTSAIFSGQWARLLTEAVVCAPPDPNDADAFAEWLGQRRQAWAGQIDVSGLAWFQRAKLPLGAFSTLLWVQWTPSPPSAESAGAYQLRAFAIGDSCLFHLRRGQLLRCFPVETADQFQNDPLALGSVDLSRDHLLKFESYQADCGPDDLLVLCTDAIAEWALRAAESGDWPLWEQYWTMTQETWEDEILQLREQGLMRCDDATLLLLRIGAEAESRSQPQAEDTAMVEVVADEPCAADAEPIVEVADEPPPESAAAPLLSPEEDWGARLKVVSSQLSQGIDRVSDQLLQGVKKLRDKAVETYRDKFGPGKK